MEKKERLTPKERNRIKKLHKIEKEIRALGHNVIAGVDEVGIGPLAGPVVSCACILPKSLYIDGINDSKKIPEEKRLKIYEELINHKDVIYSISIIDVNIIDQINIHQASLLAMKKAVLGLSINPEFLLFDGRKHPVVSTPFKAIIGGDALSISIAAASIIAKVTRDRIMQEYHDKFPMYDFLSHKGYGTSKHRKALIEHGPCEIHRKSFGPVKMLF
ncbi:MAG: Ribonuclease HII [Candidatus Anoxychlamydiales bacterium]|nr:Ribonuclease HII [Candidatus Anoxychlamydiales bacterium]